MERKEKRGRTQPLFSRHPDDIHLQAENFTQDRQTAMARGVKSRRSGKLSRARFGGTAPPAAVAAAVKKATYNLAKKNAGFVDLATADYPADTSTASIGLIATIAQGASVNQRIGKKITYKGMQIRGHVRSNAATTHADCALLIIYDRDPSGSPPALPAITDILTSHSSNAFLNDANSDRFRVLRRLDFALSGNVTAPATGNEIHQIEEYVDLKGLKAQFKAVGTGAIGDIADGALYYVVVGNQAAGTAAATVGVGFRTRFIDVPG